MNQYFEWIQFVFCSSSFLCRAPWITSHWEMMMWAIGRLLQVVPERWVHQCCVYASYILSEATPYCHSNCIKSRRISGIQRILHTFNINRLCHFHFQSDIIGMWTLTVSIRTNLMNALLLWDNINLSRGGSEAPPPCAIRLKSDQYCYLINCHWSHYPQWIFFCPHTSARNVPDTAIKGV